MTSLAARFFKHSLLKRVLNSTLQSPHFGLVSLFRQRTQWMNTPVESRMPGQIRALHVFLKGIEKDLFDWSAEQELCEQLALYTDGQPRTIRAFNLIALQEGHRRLEENPDYRPDV